MLKQKSLLSKQGWWLSHQWYKLDFLTASSGYLDATYHMINSSILNVQGCHYNLLVAGYLHLVGRGNSQALVTALDVLSRNHLEDFISNRDFTFGVPPLMKA